MIERFHRAYLEAGADIIETDTFNSNRLSMAEFGLEDHVEELNQTAAASPVARPTRSRVKIRTSLDSWQGASDPRKSNFRWEFTSTTPGVAT